MTSSSSSSSISSCVRLHPTGAIASCSSQSEETGDEGELSSKSSTDALKLLYETGSRLMVSGDETSRGTLKQDLLALSLHPFSVKWLLVQVGGLSLKDGIPCLLS
uniref:Uncharacterized protein n=1 Tax=Rhizophora mucronata TaxID=61149 RepID=A0A2P2PKM3_RHIMU